MLGRVSRRRFFEILAGMGAVAVGVVSFSTFEMGRHESGEPIGGEVVKLLEPVKKGGFSVEEAIAGRRSCGAYTNEPIHLTISRNFVGQLKE